MTQLHKRFSVAQVKELLEKYLSGKIESTSIRDVLRIGKTRFFALVERYRKNPARFTILYHRKASPKISPTIERNILKELTIDQKLIQDKDMSLKHYNYSFVKRRLKSRYRQAVSVTTVIDRAKKYGFYLGKQPKATHARIVLTDYAGQLLQHDSSHHRFSPHTPDKWYLITTLDDYSRFIFFADLFSRETSWVHIQAMEQLFVRYGLPSSFYVDSHSIFRFVRGRDDFHYAAHKLTDQVDTQWEQVLADCNVKVIYALSPQAKGKIERPYRWLQDHLVRTSARENISQITQARTILHQEIYHYNHRRVHSTTGHIPHIKFQKALKENKSLFRPFSLKPPFQSTKDVFCLRFQRTTDGYRRISFNNVQIPIQCINPYQTVTIRIYPDITRGTAELRFWSNNKLLDVKTFKTSDLKLSTFDL